MPLAITAAAVTYVCTSEFGTSLYFPTRLILSSVGVKPSAVFTEVVSDFPHPGFAVPEVIRREFETVCDNVARVPISVPLVSHRHRDGNLVYR